MNVTVYKKTGCPWAASVIDYLKQTDVPFDEKDVTADPKLRQEIEAMSGQSKSPTVVIDGTILVDTDVDEVSRFLEEKYQRA